MQGKKKIRVNLSTQTVEAFEGDRRVHRFECVSGDQAHPTDTGSFKIMRKYEKYRSHAYNVPMNFAMFFTMDGKALHQYHGSGFSVVRAFKTAVSDWFGSHGCVRLTEEDARTLFDWTPIGTVVNVY